MMRPIFTHALARRPAPNMADGLTTQALGMPDFDRALAQYENYLEILRTCALDVLVLPPDAHYPDAHFVEDTAVIYDDLAVITQPGALERRGETESIAQALSSKYRIYMDGDARLDGGDVLMCADRVLVGLSERTNRAGADQLRAALRDYDASLKVDYVPFGGLLHLKSGITELAPGVLLRSPQLQTDYPLTFAETILLPPEEGYAANVLPVNGAVLTIAGYPSVQEAAARCYTRIFALEMSEFQKMDGSLTCLSLLY